MPHVMQSKTLATFMTGMVLVLTLATPNFVAATSSTDQGSTPNGKPFQSLQSQIDDLKTQVTSLQGEINADGQAITLLQQDVANLQTQINQNSGDLTSLQAQINHDNSEIAQLQAEVSQINNLLALKQDVIHGICPGGMAVVSVNPDGSLVCRPVGGSLSKVLVANFHSIGATSTGQFDDQCPAGYTISGGGYQIFGPETVSVDGPDYTNGWFLTVTNPLPIEGSAFDALNCIHN